MIDWEVEGGGGETLCRVEERRGWKEESKAWFEWLNEQMDWIRIVLTIV